MFVAAGGFLLNSVQFRGGPRTLVSHGGWAHPPLGPADPPARQPEAAARMVEAHFDIDVIAQLADIAIPTLVAALVISRRARP